MALVRYQGQRLRRRPTPGSGVACEGVPDDHQGLDKERGTKRCSPRLSGPGCRRRRAGAPSPGRVGGLDGPPPGVAFGEGFRALPGLGLQAQVIGLGRAGFPDQREPAGRGPETAVPQGLPAGDLDVLVLAVGADSRYRATPVRRGAWCRCRWWRTLLLPGLARRFPVGGGFGPEHRVGRQLALSTSPPRRPGISPWNAASPVRVHLAAG